MYFSINCVQHLALTLMALLVIPLSTAYPTNCKEVSFPVTVTASNVYMPPDTTIDQVEDLVTGLTDTLSFLVSTLFNYLVAGQTFTIAGRYCEPENYIANRTDIVQILVHGATYDRNYWSADGPPGAGYNDTYSWVTYASQQGYPTFAFDRIGSGASTKPDPILVVQVPTQAEICHQIILLARQGSNSATNPFPRPFKKIVLIGHSMGSIIAQSMSVFHPQDADALILTGYSSTYVNVLAGMIVTAELLPADVELAKYAGTSPGYLAATSFPGILYLFWYNDGSNSFYNPKFPPYDFALRGAISVGEGVTLVLAAATSQMTGPVMVVTGEHDVLFCGTDGLASSGPGHCTPGNYLADTAILYPKSQQFNWYAVPNANHCWNYHYSAQLGFQKAHDWLEIHNF